MLPIGFYILKSTFWGDFMNYFLISGGILSFCASALHLAIIFGGPKWYIFFGAGEKMAQMAARGHWYPPIITMFIAGILAVWGLYAFAGAGLVARLPFMRFCLVGISAVYLIRGTMPFLIMKTFPNLSLAFWLGSSAICVIIGLCYAIGTWKAWAAI
ncbi:MAG: hypothetical protein FD163_1658 [Hyphomonadaceae bacterium]|nr:MAG: hypothetical protein FD163_1658 [Hyphomonadaceae bacterium]